MPFNKPIPVGKKPTNGSTNTTTFDPTFLNIKDGDRIIRFVGDQILYREHWYWCRVGDNHAYKPIIVGIFNYDEDRFVGADGEWFGNNPLDKWINAMTDEEKKEYEKEQLSRGKAFAQVYSAPKFVTNVFDRTLVIKSEGKVYYPNSKGEYAVEGIPEPHNTIVVLTGSSGKPNGEHLHQKILDLVGAIKDPNTGKDLGLDEVDIKLSIREPDKSKKSKKDEESQKTRRSFMPTYKTDKIDYPALYDLESFVKPWPYEALERLMDDEDYLELRKEYDLPLYPKKVEEELPF